MKRKKLKHQIKNLKNKIKEYLSRKQIEDLHKYDSRLVPYTYDYHSQEYVPNIRRRLACVEASTPKTFQHYTQHVSGASFGTKFEGLAISRGLPEQIDGLYHAGSVGIIMSGWLGAINYGVIVANDVDAMLMKSATLPAGGQGITASPTQR